MKLKTIDSVICKKFDAWKRSIDDGVVRSLVDKNTICAGGAIASMLMGEEVNDFDFYFTTKETAEAVADYYVKLFQKKHANRGLNIQTVVTDDRVMIKVRSTGVAETEPKVEDKSDFHPRFLSTNAITLSDKVQLVIRFYGTPDEIIENYDFVHVTNYWTSKDRRTIVNLDALLALMNKDLRYIGSKYPLCSLFRMRKFIRRGWSITAGQVLKIAMNLQHFDLLDVGILEEQLTGVDVTYFQILVAQLQEKSEGERIDENWVCALIDKMM